MKKIILTAITFAFTTMLAISAQAANINADDAALIAKDGMGIGIKKAELIVAERTARGPYKDWADLQARVKGFGKKTIEKNTTNIVFGPATPGLPTAAVAPAAKVAPVAAPVAAPLPAAPLPAR